MRLMAHKPLDGWYCQRLTWHARDGGPDYEQLRRAEHEMAVPTMNNVSKEPFTSHSVSRSEPSRVRFTKSAARVAFRFESRHSSGPCDCELIPSRACSYPRELANLRQETPLRSGWRQLHGQQLLEGYDLRSTFPEVHTFFLEGRRVCREG